MSTISDKERQYLRDLAKKYAEIANSDVMHTRKAQWKALHDLKPIKPMILLESLSMESFLDGYEFVCKTSPLKDVEARLIFQLHQYKKINDDIVFEPYFRLGWWGPAISALAREFGDIKIVDVKAKEESLANITNFPIKEPKDIEKLRHREFYLDKSISENAKIVIEEIFGDILPVRLENTDFWYPNLGNQPFIGCNFLGLTWDLFNLIGAEAIMLWPYEHPEALHKLCRFLTDDKKMYYEFLLNNGLLARNTDNQVAGASSYGYVSDLPSVDESMPAEFNQMWCWAESQESQPISPQMYEEFYLPYIAELANMFGLTYFGCCDNAINKLPVTEKQIKNIRCVSVSAWADVAEAAEKIGTNCVYSRKPSPAFVSNSWVDFDTIKADAKKTYDAAKNCHVEIIYRDIYSANCSIDRAKKYVDIWKSTFGI